MSASTDSRPLNTTSGEGLKEAVSQHVESAADAVDAASSTLTGKRPGSLGQKIALASAALQLFRRYPVATLFIGGLVVALYVMRREGAARVTRH